MNKHVYALRLSGWQYSVKSELFVYPLQAPTADVKTTWVNEIRKVLTTQLEACRGTEKGFNLEPISKFIFHLVAFDEKL